MTVPPERDMLRIGDPMLAEAIALETEAVLARCQAHLEALERRIAPAVPHQTAVTRYATERVDRG